MQRWQAEYGLPVYNLGGPKSPVFAFTNELDEWMWNRGRTLLASTTESPEKDPGHSPNAEGDDANHAASLETSLISDQAKLQSAQLVAVAGKLWDSVSFSSVILIVKHYRQAIDLNPGNAAAYAGLALGLITQSIWGHIGAPFAYASARAALGHALDINPELPLAKCAEAWLKLVSIHDWEGARQDFDCLLERVPNCARSLKGRGLLAIAEGNPEQAAEYFLRAAAQSPLSSAPSALHCWSEYLAGNFSLAMDQIGETRATGLPGPILDAVEALIAIQSGDAESRLNRLEELISARPNHDILYGALGYVLALNGQRARAHELCARMKTRAKNGLGREPYAVALTLIGLNEIQEAVEFLERSFREGSLWSLGFQVDPILDALREDAHFKLFMARASYPQPGICCSPIRHVDASRAFARGGLGKARPMPGCESTGHNGETASFGQGTLTGLEPARSAFFESSPDQRQSPSRTKALQ